MILALTPNPALDLTYEIDALRPHAEHRVRRVRAAAGGKGVNVARVLSQLGTEAVCAGPLGGATGAELRALLEPVPGVHQAWTPITAGTRRTVTLVDADGATGLNEPGPALTPAELAALHETLTAQLTGTDPAGAPSRPRAVTISGSLPPGLGGADLADLVRLVGEHGRPVLVDTSGPGLSAAARAGATVLTPNADEAREATGAPTPLEAAAQLIRLGAQLVVCSLGADGVLALARDRSVEHPGPSGPPDPPGRTDDPGGPGRAWRARLPEPLSGNPTGAGDSLAAVLARDLLAAGRHGDEAHLPGVLARAVAVSASAVTRPVAGEVDPELAARLEPRVQIEEIPWP